MYFFFYAYSSTSIIAFISPAAMAMGHSLLCVSQWKHALFTVFNEFSELTGLRGGNLLFHLQKLLDGGMILQRHERGDYMITEKGFRVLKGIADIL